MTKTPSQSPRLGQKARNENQRPLLGRIKYGSWANQVLKACDIVVYDMEIAHIISRHPKELKRTGMEVLDYLEYIVANYNEIRTGTGGSILLVVRQEVVSEWGAIELVPYGKKQEYRIKTATLIKESQLLKKKLLCAGGHR